MDKTDSKLSNDIMRNKENLNTSQADIQEGTYIWRIDRHHYHRTWNIDTKNVHCSVGHLSLMFFQLVFEMKNCRDTRSVDVKNKVPYNWGEMGYKSRWNEIFET